MNPKNKATYIRIKSISYRSFFFEECIKYATQHELGSELEITASIKKTDCKLLKKHLLSSLFEKMAFKSHTFRINKENSGLLSNTLKDYSIEQWVIVGNSGSTFFFNFDYQEFYIKIKESDESALLEWLDELLDQSVIRGVYKKTGQDRGLSLGFGA